ncbi:MAG: hypothetical protein A2W52_02000 [Candidatus Taylorbacteria bacterium RIFCSPHIGHO2_02_49_25]|uniref:Uncharacterized protein n=1 Tax=Candidatus Taylorbacteria bacterium RIFCSPHIGHO2_02_49_25 TaxID=1802305 RepID=A0A1G2MC26_9BACT|nr:MAG: hypothetical protein UY62_C0016G0010 [Parcubacteria group bacterium GW2011_GWF2_50_9]OHA21456.1 MAG: hypothetical protein A2W52_02000 [Candidatus Taylorbacteria bacterium RIFCSPHIGHO2_02_49_25]OHA35866.1 MAG: hypothetical protein A3B27_03065 [Candidatus Taylorbacteria bacterium RIFCSPLOWO2_01_FULL_50_130]OHA35926.1 MAG: hypothetical protein A2W65_03950 [Candidatus Taylorbacteria bacterium RIFCSPLOWO2_02_50_13]OHA41763.1 MAG: hypothetical protein A3H73_03960 [Candidatus Taylorbacteria ba
MKKDQKINKKLTPKNYEQMWGEDGPYSQVRLCEETRILDDSVSRVFLVVEAEINPFTFEYAQKRREMFIGDEPVLQLFDHAEYRGKFGYVISAGEVELRDEESRAFARKQASMAIQTIIRMHAFVMGECGLGRDNKYGIVEDKVSPSNHFVWNEQTGSAEPVDDGLWDNETLIGSPAGVRNNKMRCFVVLAFDKSADFRKSSAGAFAKTLKKVSERFTVEIEEAESFQEYVLITALVSFNIAPASFIEAVLDECSKIGKKPMFQKDYFITNVKRPTPEQIMSFLEQLPLDRDIQMPL